MQIPNDNSPRECSRLLEYLDGEMAPVDEAAFESHIANCEKCRVETSLHTRLEREIDSLPQVEIALPVNFSKVVAAKAESQVSGLRKPSEQRTSIAIIATLSVLVFIFLGANFRSVTALLFVIFDRIVALFSVIASFLFNLLLGVFVIVKVAATQVEFSWFALIGVFGLLLASAWLLYIVRAHRSVTLGDAKR